MFNEEWISKSLYSNTKEYHATVFKSGVRYPDNYMERLVKTLPNEKKMQKMCYRSVLFLKKDTKKRNFKQIFYMYV